MQSPNTIFCQVNVSSEGFNFIVDNLAQCPEFSQFFQQTFKPYFDALSLDQKFFLAEGILEGAGQNATINTMMWHMNLASVIAAILFVRAHAQTVAFNVIFQVSNPSIKEALVTLGVDLSPLVPPSPQPVSYY